FRFTPYPSLFFSATISTYNYTLSLHDALPICSTFHIEGKDYHYAFGINYDYTNLSHAQSILNDLTQVGDRLDVAIKRENRIEQTDRKSTRLNSSTWPTRMPSSA